MAEIRIPDATLLDRLRLSTSGIDWAARLMQPYQHIAGHDDWTAHRDVWHLIDTERHYLQPRLEAVLEMHEPDLGQLPRPDRPAYASERDITDLAGEFLAERHRSVAILEELSPQQWARTGVWGEGRVVDVAWIAERILWHEMDHLAVLLRMHNQFEPLQAPHWRGEG